MITDYAENRFGADAKYKGKFVRTALCVGTVGQEGRQPHLVARNENNLSGWLLCEVAADDPLLPTLKPGVFVTLEGVVKGREDRSLANAGPGSNFTVVITGARVLEAEADWTKLKLQPR